jgi:serine/threonine protein kinase
MSTRSLIRTIGALALIKIVLSPLGLVASSPTDGGPPTWVFVATAAVFSTAAGYLLIGGRDDQRAFSLAVSFLLVASAFSDRLLMQLDQNPVEAIRPFSVLARLQLTAFLPFAVWLFFELFPRITQFGWARRLPLIAQRASLTIAVPLLLASMVSPGVGSSFPSAIESVSTVLSASVTNSLFWPIVLVLTLAALGFGLWRATRAGIDERRRVKLLAAGLLIGGAPILLIVIVTELWPTARLLVQRQPLYSIAQAIVYPFLLSVPFTTAYAVQVHQALDVRFYLRRALQYGLARSTLLLGASVPFLLLAVVLYVQRNRALVDLMSGGTGIALLLVGVTCVTAVRLRIPLLRAVDKKFFREHYDAQHILQELVDTTRSAVDIVDLERSVTAEVDRALHPESIAFLAPEPGLQSLVARTNGIPALPRASLLVERLQARGAVVEVDPDRAESVLGKLGPAEHEWLAGGGFTLLCPVLDSDARLIAILALGEKRSELPFTREDRTLLTAVAASAGLALEKLLAAPSDRDRHVVASMARECDACGLVFADATDACPTCDGKAEEAQLPTTVAGKFLIERRIGRGGMGVVYLAVDRTLGREVAIKILPKMGAQLAWRLRREARAMAAVTHPNLAMIYGTESWGGDPLLIVEYLGGGTLRDRLAKEHPRFDNVLELGEVLAAVADCIHRAGIVHRDIKPSNIGFTAGGVTKLLDFGLAKMLEPEEVVSPQPADHGAHMRDAAGAITPSGVSESETGTGFLVGTVDYMSPEAANGETPHPLFDLWSIAVVLYEAFAGTNPFHSPSVQQTLHRIWNQATPDIRRFRPDCPPSIAALFKELLAKDRRERPQSASALRTTLTLGSPDILHARHHITNLWCAKSVRTQPNGTQLSATQPKNAVV